MTEYALFNDEAPNWTAEESVEAGFYSQEEAELALAARYTPEDELIVHVCEESEEEENEEEDEDGEDDE